MVWSSPHTEQPGQQQQHPQQHPPSPYSSEEQLKISVDGLLSLGQESSSSSASSFAQPPPQQQQQSQQQQQQQQAPREQRFQPPLNMERLWAGDLSQLPPAASPLQHPEINPQVRTRRKISILLLCF
jgi:hypothetical protein